MDNREDEKRRWRQLSVISPLYIYVLISLEVVARSVDFA